MTISTTNGDAPKSPEASAYSACVTEELQRYDEHLQNVRGCPMSGNGQSRPFAHSAEQTFMRPLCSEICRIATAGLSPNFS